MGNKSIIGQLVSLSVLAFLVWVLLASSPRDRLDRACRPVDWGGNILVSLSALFSADNIPAIQKFIANTDYSCQYTLWRLFYEDDFKQALRKKQQKGSEAGDLAAPDDSEQEAP